MAFYEICPYCKASLDPGERCDCREKEEKKAEKKQEFFRQHLKMEPKTRQLAFVFDSGEVRRESKSYC